MIAASKTSRHPVVTVNRVRKRAMARKVTAALGAALRGKIVAVPGLTFKPNTDDMRDAPSIPLIAALQDMGASVKAYDPVGMAQAKSVFAGNAYSDDPHACALAAAAFLLFEWMAAVYFLLVFHVIHQGSARCLSCRGVLFLHSVPQSLPMRPL